MDVEIIQFPETRVAAITHAGPPQAEHDTARKLVAWKLQQGLRDPARHRSYGLHHLDDEGRRGRVDFCLSVDAAVAPNEHGIVDACIPAQRCARARDVGSRMDNRAAAFLLREGLPASGERPSGAPLIVHYVNVGPQVQPHEAITDVYLPLA